MVRPVTVHVNVVPLGVVQVWPPLDVTVYLVIGEPPLSAGGVQVTTDEAFWPDVAFTLSGAVGGPDGTAGAEAADAGPVPIAFVAVTVNVYGVPLVSPVTVQVRAPVVVHAWPPLEVTVYPVIVRPPVELGAVQVTTDCVLPLDVAVTPVGAPGVVAGTMPVEGDDAVPVPEPLVAVTVNV